MPYSFGVVAVFAGAFTGAFIEAVVGERKGFTFPSGFVSATGAPSVTFIGEIACAGMAAGVGCAGGVVLTAAVAGCRRFITDCNGRCANAVASFGCAESKGSLTGPVAAA